MKRGNMAAERVRRSMNIGDIAREIGVSSNSYSRWENCETAPSSENLIKLSEYFGCDPDYLLAKTEEYTHGV